MSVAELHDYQGPVAAALDALDAALDDLDQATIDTMSHPRLLDVMDRLERVNRRLPVTGNRVLNRLAAEANPLELGDTTLRKLVAFRLRISTNEAGKRIDCAADLGPRRTLTGQPLPPVLERTAAAQARGQINTEHIAIIRKFFADLPEHIDTQTRTDAETDLVRVAAKQSPEGLRSATALLLALLHPDGDYTDAQRDRRRGVSIGNQGADGLSRISGHLTPELRATLEPIVAKWGKPGMCNPNDLTPTIDGEPTDAAIDSDDRTQYQRNHDALLAMGRNLLCSGQLGQHHGLPTTIIVTTTLQELESGTGHAITAGGTRLPMRDVIAQASHAFHYLAVFDQHTEAALYLGRTRRCATGAQRIVLYARDRGCTRPGCTASGYTCQAHHAVADWKNGGQTNIDDLTLACGPDNRLIELTEWRTRKRKDGRTEWIPPPHLDTGQARVNDLHHPERMLHPPDEGSDDGEGP
ncbi:HNH endonuclease signature motif containing protein [Mycolicibacterium sp. YH-1]|uniref:HNH endonuclease signature motif containing protein n=1 Tax=Mycolicibacterium sp. YH-1 TaxID=2908837 RepID=UPI001F4BE6D9|nr:HNH endonuclease signature motif containing protein [Mycolicibacterium sp. YH-1]UNB51681.1 HNH endonuclease [Mycolicibacterium sp. YH-1]